MRILAVDTTTARGSVALTFGNDRAGSVCVSSAAGHSRWILEAISMLLRSFGGSLQDLDALAVTVGPGSFTGLRVGMATVQGLALGAGRPVVGLSSLDVLASLAPESAPVVALVDAWREEVYAAAYIAGRLEDPPVLGRLQALAPGFPPQCVFLGDGALRHREVLRALRPEARILEVDPCLALPLARLAARVLREGGGSEANALVPLYIRGADIRSGQT
jgi:tRNA threonylcarbamoyladenosine biosynthesis protein TsaB